VSGEVNFPHGPATTQAAPGLPPIQSAYLGPATSASAVSQSGSAALTTSFPGSPTDGQQITLTDSLTAPTYYRQYQYNSTAAAWLRLSSWTFDYKTLTTTGSAISATTEGTSVAVITGNSVSFDGGLVLVSFEIPRVTVSGDLIVTWVFYRDSTVLGQEKQSIGNNTSGPARGFAYDTPASGSHTYKVAAFVSANAVTANVDAGGTTKLLPGFLRVVTA
jgi:hypothetical protein